MARVRVGVSCITVGVDAYGGYTLVGEVMVIESSHSCMCRCGKRLGGGLYN